MYLAGARWYAPDLYRWMSRDPIEYAGGDNMFAYVAGNPVKYVDPSGLNPDSTLGGNDPGFSDPNIVKELEKKLKDPKLTAKERSEILRRLKELRRRKSKKQQHHGFVNECGEIIDDFAKFCARNPIVCVALIPPLLFTPIPDEGPALAGVAIGIGLVSPQHFRGD